VPGLILVLALPLVLMLTAAGLVVVCWLALGQTVLAPNDPSKTHRNLIDSAAAMSNKGKKIGAALKQVVILAAVLENQHGRGIEAEGADDRVH
jgi:hypothetical protein